MAPKGHRAAPAAQRHSRSTSATKLPINLQFTQKKVLPRPKQPQQHPKQRPGFHIASPGDDEEEEEEDWVSSESGAATPDPHNDDDSDLESSESIDNLPPQRAELPRVATARPSDYKVEPQKRPAAPREDQIERPGPNGNPASRTSHNESAIPPNGNGNAPRASHTESAIPLDTRGPNGNVPRESVNPLDTNGNVSRTSRNELDTRGLNGNMSRASHNESATPTRRYSSRPMSSHSMNKPELRLHPLIRGQSYGQSSPKPSPLLPVAVTADVAQLTSSPSTSPTSPYAPNIARRTSISSARSVATVATTHPAPRSVREARHRTLSTLSAAPSSAALSSLTHLPTVSRPPSPQMISFFPPANPHARADDVHPLLPPPYVSNHFTVLARRTPIREAFDRVVRARQSVR
ncbi:hypothetical protein B0H12DRAFT_1118947 [Mycena haematopus]|nr:hypothetical protein B0H12DRAFT_1118947 [Mycena haematopus]